MADVAELGLKIDSSQASTAARELDRLSASGKKAQDAFAGVEAAARKGGTSNKEYAGAVSSAYGITEKMTAAQLAAIRGYETLIAKTTLLTQGRGREAAQLEALRKAQTTADTQYGKTIAGLAGAQYDLEQAQKKSTDATDKSTSAMDRFANTITRRVIGAFVLNELRQFSQYLLGLNKTLADTADTADRAGISYQRFQGLGTAAAYKGVSGDSFNAAMLAFNQQVDLGKKGLGDLYNLLRLNGTAVKSSEDAFLAVANLVQRAKGDTQLQFSILQQAGLPASREFVRLMEQGAEAITLQANSAKKLTDQQLLDAKRLDDRYNELWFSFERRGRQAVVAIADAVPTIGNVLGKLPFGSIIERGIRYSTGTGLDPVANARAAGLSDLAAGRGTPLTGNVYGSLLPEGSAGRTTQKPPADPALLRQQISLEQQRIAILGPLAAVEDQVRAKQLELNAASPNNVGVSKTQRDAILNLARAQAEWSRINDQASAGVFRFSDATKAAGHELQGWIDRKLVDPTNAREMAAANEVLARRIEQIGETAQVAASRFPALTQALLDAANTRKQMDQLFASLPNDLSSFARDFVQQGRDADKAREAARQTFESSSKSAQDLATFRKATAEIDKASSAWARFQSAGEKALNSLSDKLLDMAIKNLVGNAFGGSSGINILGLLGVGGNGLGPTGGADNVLASVGHTGGIVGMPGLGSRYVHPAYFDNAPRFHAGGIVPGEVPVIAKPGEGIFTAAQMAALGRRGGDTQITFAPVIHAPGATKEDIVAAMDVAQQRFQAAIVPTVRNAVARRAL